MAARADWPLQGPKEGKGSSARAKPTWLGSQTRRLWELAVLFGSSAPQDVGPRLVLLGRTVQGSACSREAKNSTRRRQENKGVYRGAVIRSRRRDKGRGWAKAGGRDGASEGDWRITLSCGYIHRENGSH